MPVLSVGFRHEVLTKQQIITFGVRSEDWILSGNNEIPKSKKIPISYNGRCLSEFFLVRKKSCEGIKYEQLRDSKEEQSWSFQTCGAEGGDLGNVHVCTVSAVSLKSKVMERKASL